MKDRNAYFKEDITYNEVLILTLDVTLLIKKRTLLLYNVLSCPNDNKNDPNIIFDELDKNHITLYADLEFLINNFDNTCYICSANHVYGHYLKAICLAEAGIELMKSLRFVWCNTPHDLNSLTVLLRSEMELIVFIQRYMENAVREYVCC